MPPTQYPMFFSRLRPLVPHRFDATQGNMGYILPHWLDEQAAPAVELPPAVTGLPPAELCTTIALPLGRLRPPFSSCECSSNVVLSGFGGILNRFSRFLN